MAYDIVISFVNLFWILFVFIVLALVILGIDFVITNATQKINEYSNESVHVTDSILKETKATGATIQEVNQQINDFITEFNGDVELLATYLEPIKDKLCLFCATQITPTPPNNWTVTSAVCDYLVNQKRILVCPTTTNAVAAPETKGVLLKYQGCS